MLTKRLTFLLLLFFIFILAHHCMVFLHEWTHGTIAWLSDYKKNPFDIHYGERWFTLFDIDEAVPYNKILKDGKRYIAASIAIGPTLLQMILFPIGLKLLHAPKIQKKKWVLAFIYWVSFFLLAETYSYIPIRTFAHSDDMFNFLHATGLSPWVLVIPGTLYVIWGVYRILTREEPFACQCLKIQSKAGRFVFLLITLLTFFGFYGTAGIVKPDSVSHVLSWMSWSMVPICLILLSRKKT